MGSMLATFVGCKGSIDVSFKIAIFENTGNSFLLLQMSTKMCKILSFIRDCAFTAALAIETEYFRCLRLLS